MIFFGFFINVLHIREYCAIILISYERGIAMEKTSVESILTDFYNISGMEISLLNTNFHTLVSCSCPHENVCSLIHRSAKALEICKASDIEHLVRVSEEQRGIIYTCPFGMTEAIIPVVRDENTVAYLIVSMGVSDNSPIRESLKELTSLKLADKDLEEALKNTVSVNKEKIDSYFAILEIMAKHIANEASFAEKEVSIGSLVKRYVKQNLDKKITLLEIARNLHCSTVTLTEHFKDEFGMTINEYVVEKRMEMAKKLLLTTDEPLRTVAAMLGYPDVEYFSRTFKRRFDLPPATWRKQERENNAKSKI